MTIVFTASPVASDITGAIIEADGGNWAWVDGVGVEGRYVDVRRQHHSP